METNPTIEQLLKENKELRKENEELGVNFMMETQRLQDELFRLREREKEYRDLLHEVYDWYFVSDHVLPFPQIKIESLLSKFEVPNQS